MSALIPSYSDHKQQEAPLGGWISAELDLNLDFVSFSGSWMPQSTRPKAYFLEFYHVLWRIIQAFVHLIKTSTEFLQDFNSRFGAPRWLSQTQLKPLQATITLKDQDQSVQGLEQWPITPDRVL